MSEKKEKRKIRKGKVILTVVAILILVAVVVAVVLFVKNRGGSKPGLGEEQNKEVFDLPDVTYSNMQVTNIEMEYLKDNNETMVSMIINNTTETIVERESLTAVLYDKDGNTLGQTKTYIEHLSPGEQYSISVILKGDLTATTQIQLQK